MRRELSPAVAKALLAGMVAVVLISLFAVLLWQPVSFMWRIWCEWRELRDLPPLEDGDALAPLAPAPPEAAVGGVAPATEMEGADTSELITLPPSFLVFDDATRMLTTAEELRQRRGAARLLPNAATYAKDRS